jgi:hypothetical protein
VVEAKSLGYMCSYAALTNPALQSDSASHPHSEPCCASKFFAITKMQEEYGFEGYVQSDCGAVSKANSGPALVENHVLVIEQAWSTPRPRPLPSSGEQRAWRRALRRKRHRRGDQGARAG